MAQSKFVPGLDYRTADGLQRKRLLAFVNHFFSRTQDLLDIFATNCDIKLLEISTKINRLDNYLSLLETKLSSVPVIEPDTKAEIKHKREVSPLPQPEILQDESSPSTLPDFEEVVEAGPREDPTFSRYFKMIDVGVPLEAVKIKMRLEGLDTSVLDRNLSK